MSANGTLAANSIATVNSLANNDIIIFVRDPTANTWALKGINANNLGINVNVAIGANTLVIRRGLVVQIV
jgi:hypothetical protein